MTHHSRAIGLTLSIAAVALLCRLSEVAARQTEVENSQNNILNDLLSPQPSDAPKFYALNAQLYSQSANKQATSSHRSKPDLMPLDGARINRNDGTLDANNQDYDEHSSIDGLIKAMRRQHKSDASDERRPLDAASMAALDEEAEAPGTRGVMTKSRPNGAAPLGQGGLSDKDEASIQRKSTKLAPADEQEAELASTRMSSGTALSRLRHDEPRRKRRASVRQAPPKLRSRPVSTRKRRTKLRHRIKPKRRA